jgi:outer membrane protein assembly factor BamA
MFVRAILILLLAGASFPVWSQPMAEIVQNDSAGKKFYISDIVVQGNKRTKNYIVTRDLTFRIGDSIDALKFNEELERSRQNVYNTALFNEVKLEPVKMPDSSYNIFIIVKERWYIFPLPYFKLIDRNLNVWWETYNRDISRTIYGMKFTYQNFSGRRDQLRLYVINGFFQQILLSYNQPFADAKLQHGFSINSSYVRTRNVNIDTKHDTAVQYNVGVGKPFVRDILSFSAGYSYRRGIYDRHNVRIGWVQDRIDNRYRDTISKAHAKYFINDQLIQRFPEISYDYNYSKLDYIFFPLQGEYYGFSFFKRGFGNGMNLNQFSASYGRYHKFTKKLYGSVQLAGSIKLPFDQPYYNQRFMGFNEFYLRGLDIYQIDGVAGGLIKNTLRTHLFNFNLPLKFLRIKGYEKIPFQFYGKIFGDLGYVYSPEPRTSRFNNKLLYTYGFGIDIRTMYDLGIRLDVGFNQLRETGLYVK